MEIKKINGEIIFKANVDNIKDAVEEAVMRGTDLRGANLSDANLGGADLRGANLSDAYLRGANIRYADLSGANLCCANLGGANLRGANIGGANLCGANLCCANLGGANLRCANLGDANLCGANLRGANLGGANLRGANLRCANIGGANLCGANLCGADIRDANLRGADLRGARSIPYIPLACPSDGEFTGWKKVGDKLIRLLIPADAKRSSAASIKCRCEKAKVVAITSLDEGECYEEVTNSNYAETIYRVGEMVYPDSYDDDRWNECSHGIHYFINKQDAINY